MAAQAHPVAEEVGPAPADDALVVPAAGIEGLVAGCLVPDLVLKGQLDRGRVLAHPPAQPLSLPKTAAALFMLQTLFVHVCLNSDHSKE